MDHKLYEGACKGRIKVERDIIEQLNVIVTPNNNTILHVNIAFGRPVSTKFVERALEMCPTLLIHVNDDGDTPLHVAAKKGHVDIVKVLIKHAKAQQGDLESNVTAVQQMLRMTNNDGNTAFHEAARNHNSVELVNSLMSEDHDFLYDSLNNYDETALYIAVSRGSLEVVVEMLKTYTSASYNYKGPCGMTILHAAVRRNHRDITRKILEKKYWTDETKENEWSLTREMDENGWTPLHYAAYYGHHLIVKLLLEFDAPAACIADRCRKMTALHLAAGQGHFRIVYTIEIYCPACIEQVDDRRWNYVHFAMCNVTNSFGRLRRFHWLDYLLNAKDVKGNTPLLVLASISQYTFDLIKMKITREVKESTMHSIRNQGERLHQLKDEVLELSKICREPYKCGVIRMHGKDFFQHYSTLAKETERYLIVNALIATVTFTAGLTLPGGYIQEDLNKGTAVLIKTSAFQAFVISNAIALLLSILAVWSHFIWQIHKRKRHLFIIKYAHRFTFFAMVAMVIAFVTGTYAILRPSLGLAIAATMVGSSFFLVYAYIIYKRMKLGSRN